MTKNNRIETCFSPALFQYHQDKEAIVVVLDTLRATSAIVTAFQNGVDRLIPVETIEEAKEFKNKGYTVAAERDGYVLDFADFGNSPFNFTPENVGGKTIVYSTTNGTQAIQMAGSCFRVVIGAFLNISAITGWLSGQGRDVLLLCAGWKNKFNLEDTVCAGAIADRLISRFQYQTNCDSTRAALDLWEEARDDLLGYIDKAAQRTRLQEKGLDDVIPYCHTPDSCEAIPVLKDGYLIDIKDDNNSQTGEV
jgi:2-phosphosulfolactate phosphatase